MSYHDEHKDFWKHKNYGYHDRDSYRSEYYSSDMMEGFNITGLIIIIGSVAAAIAVACATGYVVWYMMRERKRKRHDAIKGITRRVTTVTPIWIEYGASILTGENGEDGFNKQSDGMTLYDRNTVVRHRTGQFQSDGARWSRPFESGKHVFEVFWPRSCRGRSDAIGVGTESAPLEVKPVKTLVGLNSQSWGYAINRRRVVRNSEVLKGPYPAAQVAVIPDRFLMYLNMDDGNFGFGVEGDYWGMAADGLKKVGKPLYVMVGTMFPHAQITIKYRGEAANCVEPSDVAVDIHSNAFPRDFQNEYTKIPLTNENGDVITQERGEIFSIPYIPKTPPPAYKF